MALRHLTAPQYLWGGNWGARDGFSQRCPAAGWETTGISLKLKSFRLEVKNIFPTRAARQWSRFPRKIMPPLPLGVLKPQLEQTLNTLLWSHKWSCFGQEVRLATSKGHFKSEWLWMFLCWTIWDLCMKETLPVSPKIHVRFFILCGCLCQCTESGLTAGIAPTDLLW